MFNSGFRGKRASDNQGTVSAQSKFVQTVYPQPSITSWSISGTDDTALNPAGGQTVLVNGTGFATGIAATLNGATISPVTLVNPTQISFTSPALAGGSYTLIVYNSSGGAAILVPGLIYSSVPTYTTAAGSIGNVYETNAISTQVVATSDSAITYSLASGSLPSGATLYANGTITGTAPVDSGSTTYTFAVTATDAELQDVTRTFTLTINTDVVTWVTPSDGATININTPSYSQALSATDAAGYSVSYTANTLPAGLSLSAGTISGTATTDGNVTTLLTATAATTGRSKTNTINWVVYLPDAYFAYDIMLLSSNNSIQTSSFISDNSLSNNQLVVVNDTRASNFDPYNGKNYSMYFNGTSNYITFSNNAAFNFGTGDFTIEWWQFLTGGAFGPPVNGLEMGQRTGVGNGWVIYRNNSVSTDKYAFRTNGDTDYYSTVSPSSFVWEHWALVRNGSTLTWYKNGTACGTTTGISFTITDAASMYVGKAQQWNTVNGAGYFSNLRIVKGTAVYTGNFTPSTTPLTAITNTSLLIFQDSRFKDNSSLALSATTYPTTKISLLNPFSLSPNTYGGSYFDGTGDSVSMASGASVGTSDFTIEAWLYPTAWTVEWNSVFSTRASNSTAGQTDVWVLGVHNDGYPYIYSGAFQIQGAVGTVNLNNWTHMAVSRSGSTMKMFANGALIQTATSSQNYTQDAAALGSNRDGTEQWTGYITDLRLVKGTAVYTSAFTAPSSPLTNVSGTKLLTFQTNGTHNNSTFKDESYFNNIINRGGNASNGTFSPYGDNWSVYFSSADIYAPANSAWNFTADFTIEFWTYIQVSSASSNSWIIQVLPSSTYFAINIVAGTGVYIYLNSSSWTFSSTDVYPNTNTWTHVALVRSSGVFKIYVNGTASTSTYSSSATVGNGSYAMYVGNGGISPCYISNVRMVNGTAVYTSNFTPSTTPLTAIPNTVLLTCQSNRFVDNSPNSFSFTVDGTPGIQKFSPFSTYILPKYYSGYFDGSGDYLSSTGWSAAGQFGTSNFTVECWIYATGAPQSNQIIWSCNSYPNTTGLYLAYYGSAATNLGLRAGSGTLIDSSAGWALNTWLHVAVVRSGTTLTLYINGTSRGTTTFSNNCTDGLQYIGRPSDTANYMMQGYISNFRIVKGTAVYTGAFTPSTTPLTAISGTSILTLQDNTFKDNSTNYYSIVGNGDVKPRLVSPFTPTPTTTVPVVYSPSTFGGSIFLDGTGDYLVYQSPAQDPATLNFTVELWWLPTSTPGSNNLSLFGKRPNSSGYGSMWLSFNSNLTPIFSVSPSGSGWTSITSSIPCVLNTWNHIACVKNGSNTYLYINGIQGGTAAPGSSTYTTTSGMGIGCGAGDGTSVISSGYISDFRYTVGVALYTSNFYPGLSPLSNVITVGSTTYYPTLLVNGTSGGVNDASRMLDLETVGNTVVTQFSPYNEGYYSNYFNNTSAEASLVSTSSSIALGSGDFTVECWVNQIGSSDGRAVFVIGTTTQALAFYQNGATQLAIAGYNSSGTNVFASGGAGPTFTLGQWDHHAIVRYNNTITWYKNGVSVYTVSNSTNFTQTGISVGYWGATGGWVGYISNFRMVVGTAVYTSAFTPPSTALTAISGTTVLTCQSNKVIDNSSNNFTLTKTGIVQIQPQNPFQVNTGISYYLDGTGDYLTAPQNAKFAFGTVNFTVEGWFYFNAFGTSRCMFASGSTSNVNNFAMYVENGNTIAFYNNGVGPALLSASVTMTLNQWYHIAITRASSTARIFLNGTQVGSGTVTTNFVSTGALCVGHDGIIASYQFNGYIADFRVSKGYARYTSTFTPPTAPLKLN